MKFSAIVTNGKMELLDKFSFQEFVSNLEGPLVIDVYKRKKKRSLEQNSLYWLWMSYLEEQTGYEKEWWHRHFTHDFLQTGATITTPNGPTTIFGIYSTKELDTAAMAEYMDKVQRKAVEYGYVLPNPEDIDFKNVNLTNL